VALLAGFALTALFVRRRAELEPEKPVSALPQPSAPATLALPLRSSPPPVVEPIAQLPSAAPARVAPSTSAATNTVAQKPAKPARRERPGNRPASTVSPGLGVAKGLELSTKEP
jgi:hypothetical protein